MELKYIVKRIVSFLCIFNIFQFVKPKNNCPFLLNSNRVQNCVSTNLKKVPPPQCNILENREDAFPATLTYYGPSSPNLYQTGYVWTRIEALASCSTNFFYTNELKLTEEKNIELLTFPNVECELSNEQGCITYRDLFTCSWLSTTSRIVRFNRRTPVELRWNEFGHLIYPWVTDNCKEKLSRCRVSVSQFISYKPFSIEKMEDSCEIEPYFREVGTLYTNGVSGTTLRFHSDKNPTVFSFNKSSVKWDHCVREGISIITNPYRINIRIKGNLPVTSDQEPIINNNQIIKSGQLTFLNEKINFVQSEMVLKNCETLHGIYNKLFQVEGNYTDSREIGKYLYGSYDHHYEIREDYLISCKSVVKLNDKESCYDQSACECAQDRGHKLSETLCVTLQGVEFSCDLCNCTLNNFTINWGNSKLLIKKGQNITLVDQKGTRRFELFDSPVFSNEWLPINSDYNGGPIGLPYKSSETHMNELLSNTVNWLSAWTNELKLSIIWAIVILILIIIFVKILLIVIKNRCCQNRSQLELTSAESRLLKRGKGGVWA